MSLALGIHKSTLAQSIARFILRLIGWRTAVISRPPSRCVLIGAPHTSNWDFVVALLLMAAESIPIRILGKDSLFWWPLGVFMRSFGVIPVNRSGNNNLVDQIAARFEEQDEFIIGLSPEGTRSKTSRWRTGCYYIALKADVPIVMAYLDYKNKVCGLGPNLKPTGDIQADFKIIREFYVGFVGMHPQKQGEIELSIK